MRGSGSPRCADRGLGVREIARRLDRSPSTISRELRRNLRPHDGNRYDADLAHARARQRARRARVGRLSRDEQLRGVVQAKLELDWSPEQIAAWLRQTYPDRPGWWICHETIYQALYRGGHGGLSRELTRRLRTARPLRKRRRRADERTPRFVVPGLLIGQRPPEAIGRGGVGDWEGDLIVGRMSQSAIGTLVDRRSRLVRLIHLPEGHRAEDLVDAIAPVLASLPEAARLTLTWEQGSEIARHDAIAVHFAHGVFFAAPGSPWQRGTNENTNGLLRQYFPKGSDLRRDTVDDLREAEDRLNNRPRKTLGWRTPAEVFHAALTG